MVSPCCSFVPLFLLSASPEPKSYLIYLQIPSSEHRTKHLQAPRKYLLNKQENGAHRPHHPTLWAVSLLFGNRGGFKICLHKKLQIQEKEAQEVKLAIKPFYQNKDITKEEYKETVRKAVDKVCQSKSGEVNSTNVANLVKAYVDKYKYSWKGNQKKTLEEPMSADKNLC